MDLVRQPQLQINGLNCLHILRRGTAPNYYYFQYHSSLFTKYFEILDWYDTDKNAALTITYIL